MSGLVRVLVDWPLVASLALAITAQTLWAGRRRGILNEALHEVRRPLQALALAAAPGGGSPSVAGESVQLAASALERLEREINGGPSRRVREPVPCRALVEAAVGRWQSRARISGVSLRSSWDAGAAVVEADRVQLAQALDNLIVNAIEHGGPAVEVGGELRDGWLRLAVADSGRASRPASRRDSPAAVIARLSGRRRRGHGLPIVRRVAAAHGGHLVFRRGERGSSATLVLPLRAERPATR